MARRDRISGRTEAQVLGGEALRLKRYLERRAPGAFPDGAAAYGSPVEANEGYVAQRMLLEVLARAARQLGPAVGVEFGREIRCADLGLYGFVIQTAPTLHEGLRRAVRFQRLVVTWGQFSMRREPRSSWFAWNRPPLSDAEMLGARVVSEIVLTEHVAMFRELERSATPLRVRFMHGAPRPSRVHASFFACPIEWGAHEIAVEWSREPLDARRPVDASLDAFLLHEAERRLAALPSVGALEEIEQAIARALLEGQPSLEPIASTLGHTPRSLRHVLTGHHVTFRGLVDRVRAARSRELIASGLSLTETAARLGYSELSALSRALRRWGVGQP
jgi:AraC-like DNA-binding protein